MSKTTRWILMLGTAAIALPIAAFVGREVWRARVVLAFCHDAQPGMSLAELLALEKYHGVDESYLVQAAFKGYVDQVHADGLEFRSHMYDPEFACYIAHDGHAVKSVHLLTLDGQGVR